MSHSIDRRNRLHSLEAEVEQRWAEAARNLWQVGRCLLEVRDEELWRDDGHLTFDAWLDSDRVCVGRVSGYKALRVAEHFGGEMAARFGTEKLNAAVSYLQATSKEEKPGDLLALDVRLRGEDGRWHNVPFVDASTAQIRQAIQLLGERRRGSRVPKELHSKISTLNAALPKVAEGRFKTTKVTVKRRRNGQLMLSMQEVPIEDLDAFIAAVRAHLV